MCGSRGGGGGRGSGPPSLVNHKFYIKFYRNWHLDPPPPPPTVNSWTPRIPGKFWTKKTQNRHKKIKAVFSLFGLGPPPLSLTKKIWIYAYIDPLTAHPRLTQCQKELYGYFCTLAELSTNHRSPILLLLLCLLLS